MSMLKKGVNNNAFGKVGVYGDAGSGKTFTSSCLAIGLHKFAGCKKPIAFFDTEPAFNFVLPLFKAAEIEVFCYNESRALADLMKFMAEAEKECSVVIIDSITHVWRDLQASYIKKVNEARAKYGKKQITALEFQDWGPIKEIWRKFTDVFLSSKLHVIVCGRMGSVYEYQTNDRTGKKELVTNGNKMATEKELGYEPSLLIEMVKYRENGKIVNKSLVEKDRSNNLNGDEVCFKSYKGVSLPNILTVFDKFKPHFESLNLGGSHFSSMDARDSVELFPEVDGGEWPGEQRQRAILCEEIQGEMLKYYPGQTGEEKKAKAELIERFAGTRSWTKVENTNSEKLKAMYKSMKEFLENKDKVELVNVDQPVTEV